MAELVARRQGSDNPIEHRLVDGALRRHVAALAAIVGVDELERTIRTLPAAIGEALAVQAAVTELAGQWTAEEQPPLFD